MDLAAGNTARSRLSNYVREEDGANLVEAALIIPMLMLVICSIIEYSAMLYVRMALQNGATQATRFAITRNVLGGMSREDSIKAILRTKTPGVTIDDAKISFSHLSPGSSTWDAGTGPAESVEKLTVEYQWQVVTPLMAKFFPDDGITMHIESVMKNESDPNQ